MRHPWGSLSRSDQEKKEDKGGKGILEAGKSGEKGSSNAGRKSPKNAYHQVLGTRRKGGLLRGA